MPGESTRAVFKKDKQRFTGQKEQHMLRHGSWEVVGIRGVPEAARRGPGTLSWKWWKPREGCDKGRGRVSSGCKKILLGPSGGWTGSPEDGKKWKQ